VSRLSNAVFLVAVSLSAVGVVGLWAHHDRGLLRAIRDLPGAPSPTSASEIDPGKLFGVVDGMVAGKDPSKPRVVPPSRRLDALGEFDKVLRTYLGRRFSRTVDRELQGVCDGIPHDPIACRNRVSRALLQQLEGQQRAVVPYRVSLFAGRVLLLLCLPLALALWLGNRRRKERRG